jgi:hypothetical protein
MRWRQQPVVADGPLHGPPLNRSAKYLLDIRIKAVTRKINIAQNQADFRLLLWHLIYHTADLLEIARSYINLYNAILDSYGYGKQAIILIENGRPQHLVPIFLHLSDRYEPTITP